MIVRHDNRTSRQSARSGVPHSFAVFAKGWLSAATLCWLAPTGVIYFSTFWRKCGGGVSRVMGATSNFFAACHVLDFCPATAENSVTQAFEAPWSRKKGLSAH